MRRHSRRPPRASIGWWCLLIVSLAQTSSAAAGGIDVVVNIRDADAVSQDPPALLPYFQSMSKMDNSDVFVALCTPGTFSPDHEGVCHDCTVCRPGQFEKLPCIPVRDRTCANCTVCSDHEIELCQCSVKTTQCVTGDRVCVKVVPTSVTLTIDLTAKSILTSRQQTLLRSGLATGYADWLGLQFDLDPLSIELSNFVRLDQLNYKATFTFTEVYGEAIVYRIKESPPEFYQGGLSYTFGGTGRRRLLGESQSGRQLLQTNSLFLNMNLGSTAFSCNASSSSCTNPFTQFTPFVNGTGCSGTCNPMCPPGYGAVSGAQNCEPCSEGYFKNETAFALCTACPDGFPLSPAGSNSSWACQAVQNSTTPPATSRLSSTSSQRAPSQTSTARASSSGPSQTSSTSASLTPAQTTAVTALASPSSGQTSSSASLQSTSGSASPSSSFASSSWPLVSSSPSPLPSTSSAPPSTSSQSTQSMQPPSSSSPSSGGGWTGGGSAASNSAIASNANTDTNNNVNAISPTLNSNSDSHASNTANNVITVNVPKGDPRPIFNRNVITVVLPPASMPREYYHKDDDDDGRGYLGYMPQATAVNTLLFFCFFFSLCFVTVWVSMQCQAPIQPQHHSEDRPVIRYRLVRTHQRDEEGGA